MTEERVCRVCGISLQIRDGEFRSAFLCRNTCSRECAKESQARSRRRPCPPELAQAIQDRLLDHIPAPEGAPAGMTDWGHRAEGGYGNYGSPWPSPRTKVLRVEGIDVEFRLACKDPQRELWGVGWLFTTFCPLAQPGRHFLEYSNYIPISARRGPYRWDPDKFTFDPHSPIMQALIRDCAKTIRRIRQGKTK